MEEELGSPESSGTFIIPILERLDEASQRQVDNDVRLQKTLESLLKFLGGYGGDRQGGRGGGQPPEKNPLQNKNPSSLMNVFSWMGEKKDKAVDFIKKGFFKLFKTDYFGNLFKAINNLAKALTNSFMSWLKFFLMMAFIDPSGGFLRDIINLFTEIGMMLFKIIMPLIPVAVKMMFDTIVYVFKLVLRLMPEIISTIMQTFTQLGNTFPILKPIIFFINQFLGAIRSLFVILNDPKADKGKGFQNFLSKVFKILGSAVEKILDFVVEKAPIVFNYLLDFIQNTLIPALIKYVPKILDAFSQGIDALIKKYPDLKIWLQPFKDILDMLSAYIGSFAKFNPKEFIEGIEDYKKKEQALFNQRKYQNAGEETRLKMLEDLQKKYIEDNKTMIEKANVDFNKMNEDKLNLAKTKWSEFLDHIMESLGKAYDSLPTSAKVGIWTYLFLTIGAWLISIGTWFVTNKVVLLAIGTALKSLGVAIGTFLAGLSAVTIGIVIAIAVIIGLIWYFWDDIKKFFSEGWDSLVKWWDTVDIMGPLKKIGKFITDYFVKFIEDTKNIIINPLKDIISDIINFVTSIKLPDWLTNPFGGGMGGGTDASELENSRKPQNASLDAYTFDEIAKQRHEAEKNYLKSNQFLTDKKLEKRYELGAIEKNNLFSDYGKNFTTKIEDEVKKNPLNLEGKVKVNTNIEFAPTSVKPEIKYDWSSVLSSLDSFSLTFKILFKNLVYGIQKLLSGPILTPMTGVDQLSVFDKFLSQISVSDKANADKMLKLDTYIKEKGLSDLVNKYLSSGTDSLLSDIVAKTGKDSSEIKYYLENIRSAESRNQVATPAVIFKYSNETIVKSRNN